jgi:hypothetical protein
MASPDVTEEKIAGAIRGLERIKADFKFKGANATTIERAIETLRSAALAKAPALTSPPSPVQGWQPIETMPTEVGTRVRALVETEIVMEERIPSLLMGGWRGVTQHRIVGWMPLPSSPAEEGA